jgi:8-oxo-dGTP pyrophosphatase MutT (NUDIX family)
VIREAASVILLRRAAAGFEVFFVRRHRGASFMASAYVFPGGATEDGEDARTAAARELFEEAGVLLARDSGQQSETLELPNQAKLRQRILAGTNARAALKLAGLVWSTDGLVPWSHWITPSIEAKRFSARFYVTEIPPGQEPRFDDSETVDQVWLTPSAALERSGELQLPPPQVRTCWELAQCATIEAVLAAGRARAEQPHPIMPRLAPGEAPCLLLPWDPEYTTRGTGEATPLTYRAAWAHGPSRFVLEDRRWKHVEAPTAPGAPDSAGSR